MVYLYRSRFLTHAAFWIGYYVLFSLVWAKPEQGYFASFYLEFILMPVRILAVYCMLYWLIPAFLTKRRYSSFVMGYFSLVMLAGLLQMLISYLFFSQLMPDLNSQFTLSFGGWVRSMILINTTVLLLGALKVFQMYIELQEKLEQASLNSDEETSYIEVKADRKIHRLKISDILFLEGMGNYVTYHLENGEKRIVYGSLKQSLNKLPKWFVRAHRSFVVNTRQIDSYSQEELNIAGHSIPRGKDVSDKDLLVVTVEPSLAS